MNKQKTVDPTIGLSRFIMLISVIAFCIIAAVSIISIYDISTYDISIHDVLPYEMPIIAHAQEYTDTPPSLVVSVDDSSRYVFLDDAGYGVMVGMVENSGSSHVSDVYIQVKFFDDAANQPVDVVSGVTLLDVIPPNSKTPFIIKSSTPDLDIVQASAKIVSIESAPQKESNLHLQVTLVESFEINKNDHYNLVINGSIQNGPAPSSNTVVHVVFHDAFNPPRTLDVKTIPLGELLSDETTQFSFVDSISSNIRSFSIFAESDIYHSDALQQWSIPLPSFSNAAIPFFNSLLPATIIDVSLRDNENNKLGSISVGEYVNIETTVSMQFADAHLVDNDDDVQYPAQPYVLYVQIKDSSGSSQIEFIEEHEGKFVNQDTQTLLVDWIPENPGLYIAETFVWDENNIPLAERGNILLVLVEE